LRQVESRHLLVLALAALLGAASVGGAADDSPRIDASAYVLQVAGKTLWEQDAHKRLPAASLTKIMTGLLVLERGRLDAVASVSRAAAAQGGSRAGLKAGDRLRVGDLLALTLVRSANDACRALAEHHAGSEARFVALMNRRAAALGLADTRFVNACGWDSPGHYSSAADLAALTETALRFPTFAALGGMAEAEIQTADGRRTFRVRNTNALLGRLPGASGVKSGFTRRAGPCVVALAERGGVRVLLVLLNAANRWWVAHGLVEQAFALPAGEP